MIEVSVERGRADGSLEHLFRRRPVSWQVFHGFRNAILRALGPFGSVGPMGEAPITDDAHGPPEDWPVGALEPRFFVVDDQWHEDVLSTKVECEPSAVSASTLHELLKVTSQWKGSIVVVALDDSSHLVVSTGRLLIRGAIFPKSCVSVEEIVKACRATTPGPE